MTHELTDRLHAAILNLPAGVPPVPDADRLPGSAEVLWAQGYKYGHRDARHAAAEAVLAHLAQRGTSEPGAMWDRFIAAIDKRDGIEHVNLLGSVEKYRQAFIAASPQAQPMPEGVQASPNDQQEKPT